MRLNSIRLASFCVLGLLFLSQFVPTAYVEIKAALLGLGLFFVFISMIKRQLFLLRWQVLGIAFLVTCGLLYSAYGLARNNPGAIRVLSVWFMWPLVYLAFSTLLRQPNAYLWMSKVLAVSLLMVVGYAFLYLGNEAGFVPGWLYIELDQGQIVGFYDGFFEYNLYSISSLIFLLPFYTHYLLEKYKRTGRVGWKPLALVLAAFILSLMTGRRAMIATVLLLPLLIILSNSLLHNNYKLRLKFSGFFVFIVFSIGFSALFFIFGFDYKAVAEMFIEGFDFSSFGGSASERTLQFNALVDGWLNSSILFGAGNGAAAAISRSSEFPWAYELTYVYLLFSTGLVGILVYFGWYAYGLWRLRDAMRKRPDLIIYAAPMLTASVAFCIAASSNPYFGKFDYLWIVLLPFLVSGWAKFQGPVIIK